MEKRVVIEGMNSGTMLTVSSGPYDRIYKIRSVGDERNVPLQILGELTARSTLVHSFGELNEGLWVKDEPYQTVDGDDGR